MIKRLTHLILVAATSLIADIKTFISKSLCAAFKPAFCTLVHKINTLRRFIIENKRSLLNDSFSDFSPTYWQPSRRSLVNSNLTKDHLPTRYFNFFKKNKINHVSQISKPTATIHYAFDSVNTNQSFHFYSVLSKISAHQFESAFQNDNKSENISRLTLFGNKLNLHWPLLHLIDTQTSKITWITVQLLRDLFLNQVKKNSII
jgi:hypothetical protein